MSTTIETVTIGNTVYRLSDTQALEAITALSTTPVDYAKIINKPSINGKELTGNITIKEGIQYTAGTGISIADGVISCTVTPSSGSTYTAGEGITISNNTISVDFTKAAVKEHYHGIEAINGLALTLERKANQDAFELLDQEVDELQETVTELNNSLGNINTILDEINGEVI